LAYLVRYRRRAERDFEQLAKFATPEWFDGLADAIHSLDHFPERCAFAPEPGLRQKGVRQLLYGRGRGIYRILYLIKDEYVEILTIRHSHRRPIERP